MLKFMAMDDLLVRTEGRYTLVTRVQGKEDDVTLQLDPFMNLAIQVWITEASNLVAIAIYLIRRLCYSVLVVPMGWTKLSKSLCKSNQIAHKPVQ